MDMTVVSLSDSNDTRLDPFRNLKGQTRRLDATFVAESEIVLDRLFEANVRIRSLLITPARVQRLHDVLAARIAANSASNIAVYVAPQAVIDEVVGYPLHRGVIALADRPPALSVPDVLRDSRTVVVLENVMDPENVGAVFRHAAGFGVDSVILVGHTGDPLYRKTIRTSMGWTLTIPYARTDADPVVVQGLLAATGFVTLALTPDRSADRFGDVLDRLSPTARIALLFGAEGPGLKEQTLASSHHRVRLPLADGVDSLNVSTAAAIALYALTDTYPARLSVQ